MSSREQIQVFSDFDGTGFNSTRLWQATTIEVARQVPEISDPEVVASWNTRFKEVQHTSSDERVHVLGGFCIHRMLEEKLDLSGSESSQIMRHVTDSLKPRAAEFVFEDAAAFFEQHTSADNPGYFITHGRKRMQDFKWRVLSSEFPPFTKFVSTLEPKQDVINSIRNEGLPAVYIDDRWKGLNTSLREMLGETGVQLFHLNRDRTVNKYHHEQPLSVEQSQSVPEVATFDELARRLRLASSKAA